MRTCEAKTYPKCEIEEKVRYLGALLENDLRYTNQEFVSLYLEGRIPITVINTLERIYHTVQERDGLEILHLLLSRSDATDNAVPNKGKVLHI